jgi:hypothetical protein
LNGRSITFVSLLKYLVQIFDKRITYRLHTKLIEAKTFRTFTRIYSLFRSKYLSANIILTIRKALTRSVITYACPT